MVSLERNMSVSRFFWVASRRGAVAHMAPAPTRRKSPVEGDLLYCGRILPTSWSWLRSRFSGLCKGPAKVCAQCAAHMPAHINVARARAA